MAQDIEHIAIIMDGNGRWAKLHGSERLFGHENGINSVRSTIEGAVEAGVRYITLYVFSTENWKRPQAEVDGLMNLIVSAIAAEREELVKNSVKVEAVGDLNALSEEVRDNLDDIFSATEHGDKLTLTLALNYSGRWDMINATKTILSKCVNDGVNIADIDEKLISSHLSTALLPDPDLIIRTGGECRLSNFLLWESAYSELYFIDKLWPDFNKDDLFEAIENYRSRERRFGKTSEQIEK